MKTETKIALKEIFNVLLFIFLVWCAFIGFIFTMLGIFKMFD